MRIAFYGEALSPPSGAAAMVYYLGKYLVKQEHEVVVVTRVWDTTSLSDTEPRYEAIMVGARGNSPKYHVEFAIKSLLFFLRNDFDVIHSMASYHVFAPLARIVGLAARRPVVYSILSPADASLRLLGFDRLISVSKHIHSAFQDIGTYIPPCVDLEVLRRTQRPYPYKDGGSFVVGIAGPPDSRRGIDYIVESIPLVVGRFPKTRFILAIDLPHTRYVHRLKARMDRIRKSIEDFGLTTDNVQIVGQVDMPRFFKSLDVFVYAVQTTKGMVDIPITVLESLGAGCPLISAEVGGVSEVIQNYENGILVPAHDRSKPAAYAEKIAELIENKQLAHKLHRNGPSSIREYDVHEVAPQIVRLYQEVLTR